MPTLSDHSKTNVLKWWAQASGITAIVSGGVALCGWLFQIHFLIAPLLGHAGAKANACLCLVLSGVALLLITKKEHSSTAMLLAIAVVTISVLTLAEWHSHISFGIDQLLCPDISEPVVSAKQGRLGPPVAGRMGPNTAQCFILIGLALLTLQRGRHMRLLANVFTSGLMLISLFSVVGNLYEVPRVYNIQSFTEMAPLNSLLFLVLSFGILCSRAEFGLFALLASDTTGGLAGRRFLPACIIAPIIVGWWDLRGQLSGLYPVSFTVAVLVICMVIFLILLIWWVAHSMAEEEEARKVASQQRLAVEQAQSESRFKSEFLASMSHEVRTPLNGILGMTEILLKSGLNDKQIGFANIISEAGKSLLTVINDILDFSKIEAGKLVLENSDFDPVKLVEGVADLLTPQAADKKLSLLTFIDPEIPHSLISDTGRLRQILTNLTSNAVKFSDKGEVLIKASLVEKNETTATIKFSVTDNGIGMSEEEVSRLFLPFVQLSDSIGRAGGTGLGLSISKKLVELLGGQIGLNSVKGQGTTFWVTLTMPMARAIEDSPRLLNLAGTRILVVDDKPTSGKILHDYLVSWGLSAVSAADAEEALTILRDAVKIDPYKVAIIDLPMPDNKGLALAKIIYKDAALKDTKLILVTAFDKPGLGEDALMLGLDAYLTKPVKQSQLRDCIKTALSETKSKSKEKKATSQKTNMPNAATTRNESILVADDNLINEQVAVMQLRLLGFEAKVARDGEQAVEMIKNDHYDLIFMDCQMPVMDGFEATRAIRQLESESAKGWHVPVIAMTAHVMEGSREECLAAGMDDYISKPVALEQLRAVVEKWLPLHEHCETDLDDSGTYFPQDLMQSNYGEAAPQVASLFLENIAGQLKDLKQAIDNKNMSDTLKSVHKVRGSAGTIYAEPLIGACLQLEALVRASNWEETPALMQTLEARIEKTIEIVQSRS